MVAISRSVSGNIWKLYVIKACKWFMLYMPIIILFYRSNGMSMQQVFILQGAYSFAVGVFEIPSGYFSDILGRKLSMVIGAVLGLIGYLIFSVSFEFYGFLTALISLGIGHSFISGTDTAILYDSLVQLNRSNEFLKFEGRTVSIGNFSEGIASIAGGLLALISLRYTFFVQAIIGILTILISLTLIEPERTRLSSHKNWDNIKYILRFSMIENKGLKWTIIYSSVIGISTLTMAWFVQPYFIELQLPEYGFGILWAALNLSVGTTSWFAHIFERELGRRTTIWLILIMITGCYFLIATNITWWGIGFIFLFYLIRGIATPTLRDYINRLTSSEMRATVLSIRSLIIRIGFAVLGPFFGWATDYFSLATALKISGGCFLAIGFVTVFLMMKHEKE